MIIFPLLNDKVSPLQQEGFQLSSEQRAGTHAGNHQGGRDRHHTGNLGRAMGEIKKTLDSLTMFVRQEKLPYTILHEKEIPASLLEKAKKAVTI